MLRIANSKDLLSGILFLAVGLGVCFVAWGYPLGSASEMGPGYFPLILGAALVLFGAVLVLINLRVRSEPVEKGSLRAVLLVIGGILAFGLSFKPLGLIAAALVLVAVSAAASPESRPREVLILYVGLTAFLIAIFVYALSLPINLWPSL